MRCHLDDVKAHLERQLERTKLMLSGSGSRPHILVIINTAGGLEKVHVPGGGK